MEADTLGLATEVLAVAADTLGPVDALDRELIAAWHGGYHPDWLDEVAPVLRNKRTWIPLYFGLFVWLVRRYGALGFYNALAAGLTVGIADFLAAGVIKPLVGRLRPCNQPGLADQLDLLTGCGPGLSMPSAHAANHFALAAVLATTCFATRTGWKWAGVVWAAAVALAQVYVGRHYFSDIAVGAGLGAAVGACVGVAFSRYGGRGTQTQTS